MSRQKKGINTFSGYQEARQRRREALIVGYLAGLKRMRVEFKYVTQLAEMVTVHISQAERSDGIERPCNVSTLLRNKRYKALLLSYMATEMVVGARKDLTHRASEPVKDLTLIEAQLEANSLRNENQRLKTYIDHLEADIARQERPILNQCNEGALGSNQALAELQYKYAQTCKSLLLVLQRLHLYAMVDKEAKVIVDRSVRRGEDRIIASAKDAAPFCEWLYANSFLESPRDP